MTKKTKKYKMISINYTNQCRKKKRCSFCYLKKASIFSKLKEGTNFKFGIYGLDPKTYELLEETKQVAIAYNGIEIYKLINILRDCQNKDELVVNITTNPKFININVAALFSVKKVKMVALSLDPEKGTVKEWIRAAKVIRRFKIHVGANILMLDEIFSRVPNILVKIEKYCGQIHLLRPKFYKTKIPLEKRREMIWLLKQKHRKLFIDECFKWEFLNEPCTRGKDFISINADGTTSFCSFDIYGDNKKRLKKCPYI